MRDRELYSHIQPDDLPESIQWMVDLIGFPSVIKLVKHRGGGTFYVPAKLKDKHWLVELIGKRPALMLREYYRGDEIEVPSCKCAKKKARDRIIRHRYVRGHSIRRLAGAFHLEERTVRGVVKDAPVRLVTPSSAHPVSHKSPELDTAQQNLF